MKKFRIVTCLLTAALIAASFAGCGSTEAKTSNNATQKQRAPKHERATMAKIVSLDGDQLTVVLADMPGGGKGDGAGPGNGTPPAIKGQQGDGQTPADGNTPTDGAAKADGSTPPAAPPSGASGTSAISGAAVDGKGMPGDGHGQPGQGGGQPGQGGGQITFGTEETTYTLSDDVTVKKGFGDSATEIDLSELKADEVIRFTTSTDSSGNEVIDSITIME